MTTIDMLPYEQLKKDFEEAVRDKDIFESPKIKIIRGQTGLGKSYYQDNEMPVVLKEVFPELQYIIRVSPTTEVANDGTFKNVDKFIQRRINIAKRQLPLSSHACRKCYCMLFCNAYIKSSFWHLLHHFIK